MKHILNDADRTALEKHIRDAEKQTGVQIVLAVTKKSDSYTEIPWKAFALAVSVTGLTLFFIDLLSSLWITQTSILLQVASILVAGALFAFPTLLLNGYARLFLTKNRKETETLQYAESLFLSHELFASEGRRGVLLLVSKFERQVVILPDTGVKDRLSADTMRNIISGMTDHLSHNDLRKAMEAGLERLVSALSPPVTSGQGKNELSDKIIEEDGV